MFTQQMPFMLSALRNSVDESTAMQMAQAFGNCNQPLSHRAGVTLNRSALPQSGGVLQGPGGNPYSFSDGQFGFLSGNDPASQLGPWAFDRGNYYGGDTFNNSTDFAFRSGDQFLAAYPDAAANAFYNLNQSFQFGPISTVNNSPWYTRMGDVNNFDFTTRLGDTINNFAGPTFNVAGDSYFDNSFHNNQNVYNQNVNNEFVENSNVTNLTVQNITKLGGDPGPPGGVGPAGPPGVPGLPVFIPGGGGIGVIGGYRPGPLRLPAPTGKVGFANNGQIDIPKYRMPDQITFNLPSFTFNPDTCQIDIGSPGSGQSVTATLGSTALVKDGTEPARLPAATFTGDQPPPLFPSLIPKPGYP